VTRFDIGDVVVLKSGGPDMTVIDVASSRVLTVWFERNAGDGDDGGEEWGDTMSDWFPPAALERKESEDF
jgi:uncharacterized protein YodC (DUF2158 family)